MALKLISDPKCKRNEDSELKLFLRLIVGDSEVGSRIDNFGVGGPELFSVRKIPRSNGSSLHGISHPRQKRDHVHRAQIRPPSATARNVNGNS